ncbi:hypothetical protein ACHAXA_006026 [Cyclostephanos tholiformis]|uniref:Mechanosensitive ion channel MscS domain-containing protein n=1 Tax=Cyclostephanos tholiformis TaxID=382380 RepID=A0ABD3SRG2_9STRA
MSSSKFRILSIGALLLSSTIVVVHGAKIGTKSSGGVGANDVVVGGVESGGDDTALMGKVFPLVSRLFRRKRMGLSLGQVFRDVTNALHEGEIAIFALFGWALVPLARNIYELRANATTLGGIMLDDGGNDAVYYYHGMTESHARTGETYFDITPRDDDDGVNDRAREMGGEEEPPPKGETARGGGLMVPFGGTRLFHVIDHISQASRIGLSVIAIDYVSLVAKKIGYNPWNIMDDISRIYSKVVFTGWIAYRFKLLKSYILDAAIPGDLGKLRVFDRLFDGMICLGWAFSVLNYLEVQTGLAITSLFGVGATGTLVSIFGLASKDIASQLLSGILLHMSDKMFEGDDVRFSDGTSGRIVKMGWFETMIRNSDELVVGVPNSELSGQRVYNLSRTPKSQVQQTLRVSYNDGPKIQQFLQNIKSEIRKLPKLITDGSSPFRAHWRSYEDDHLQIVVDCHFHIRPTGDEYWDNRQRVLEAIYEAATKTGVHFEIRADG